MLRERYEKRETEREKEGQRERLSWQHGVKKEGCHSTHVCQRANDVSECT